MDDVSVAVSNPLPTPSTVPAAMGDVREARRRLGHFTGGIFIARESFRGVGRVARPSAKTIGVEQVDHGVDNEWDSDTDIVAGGSEVEVGEILEPTVVQTSVAMEPRVRAPVRVFASFDAVDFSDLFERRAKVMRSVPHVLKGAFRMALRVACQEIQEELEANTEVRVVRGWKLFLVLPRMMLFRPSRGGVSRKKLESRVRQFQEGDWMSLLRESVSCADVASFFRCSTPAPWLRRGGSQRNTRPLFGAHGGAFCCTPSLGRSIKETPSGEEGSQS